MSQLQEKIASKEQELKDFNESMSRLAHSNSEYEEKVLELTELLKTTAQSLSCAKDKNTALESEIVEVRSRHAVADQYCHFNYFVLSHIIYSYCIFVILF